MMPGVLAHLAVGAVAAAVTASATPLVRRVAVAAGLRVAPHARHLHTAPTPSPHSPVSPTTHHHNGTVCGVYFL